MPGALKWFQGRVQWYAYRYSYQNPRAPRALHLAHASGPTVTLEVWQFLLDEVPLYFSGASLWGRVTRETRASKIHS